MAAPKGNTYYQLIKNWKHGADRKYTPETLWDKFIEYYGFIEDNPLKEGHVFSNGYEANVNKMRAMTASDFCTYANITYKTLTNYEQDEAYLHIITRIRQIIFNYKYQGAAAGLLEGSIVARELGLIDRRDITSDGDKIAGSPLNDISLEKLLEIQKIIDG